MKFYLKLWLCVLLSMAPWSLADNVISLTGNKDFVALDQYVSIIEDENHLLSFEQAQRLPPEEWQRNNNRTINLGYSDSSYWIKISLHNISSNELDKIFEIGYPVLDYIDIYIIKNNIYHDHIILGDKYPFKKRLLKNKNFLIPISFSPNEKTNIFIKVKTTSAVQVPLKLWNPINYHESNQSRNIFQGIYFGIAIAMIIYSLFVYLVLHEKVYLYYAAFIICSMQFLYSMNGLSFQYLWPNATLWNDKATIFFLNGALFFGVLFSINLLSIKSKNQKPVYYYYIFFVWIAALQMTTSLIFEYNQMIQQTLYLAIIICSSLLITGLYQCYQGDISARYFTLGWIFILLGGIALALNKFKIITHNLITENIIQIGSAIEIILLSLALADLLNQEKKKKIEAQKNVLKQERRVIKTQEEILKIQKKDNLALEKRVLERTIELEKANERLIELSAKDALTGIKNRRFFDEKFQQYYTSAYRLKQPLSLLIIDIDFFKLFNDNHGHLIGDECLKMVAENIQHIASRPEDISARYGGEEFVVLLPDTCEQGAQYVAEKIRQRIAETPFQLSQEMLKVTVSIGATTETPKVAGQQKNMFDRADEALYLSKNNGRNKVSSILL